MPPRSSSAGTPPCRGGGAQRREKGRVERERKAEERGRGKKKQKRNGEHLKEERGRGSE